MKLVRYICLVVLSCVTAQVVAQADAVSVAARIDSTQLWIGDQAQLTLEVGQDAGQSVQFPLLEEQVIELIEIVERSAMDTVDLGHGRIQVSQRYTITSFDDSLYYIPPFAFATGEDTVWSSSLSLSVVQPFVIDTVNNAIADIKGIYAAKINWMRILIIVLIVLLSIGLGVLIYFLWKKYRPLVGAEAEAAMVPARPPYEVVIEQLDHIKLEKQWQQHGRQKQYHSELTDALRQYFDGVYALGCMEMTTDEILAALRPHLLQDKSSLEVVRRVLMLADLVKFAKWNATPDEHERSLTDAYSIVNVVKELTEPVVESVDTESGQS